MNYKEYSLSELKKLKNKYDDAYYNGTSLVSDKEYDKLIEYMESIGYKKGDVGHVPKKNKIVLPYYLGSLDKVKDIDKLDKWKSENKCLTYIITDKLDGISTLYYKGKMYTRGNGKIGSDISHYSKHFFNNSPHFAIRGELVISKHTFKYKYSDTFSNARNFVSGVINSKEYNENIKDIDFIPYEIITEDTILDYKENLDTLSNEFKNSIEWITMKYSELTYENLRNYLEKRKEKCPYEIDGLVIQGDSTYTRYTDGNPKYSIAFKCSFDEDKYTGTVINVEWRPSFRGVYKPRITINPVECDNVKIEHFTGFNAKYIKDNNIGVGTIIEFVRSGGVIPHIVNIKKSTNPLFPDSYKWNNSGVDILVNEYSEEVEKKKICYFFKTLEIENVDKKTIDKLWANGYDNVFKILDMKKKDFLNLPSFAEKMSEKIYNNIHNGKSYSLWDMMSASCVFPFGISSKKFKLLVENMNIFEEYDEDTFLSICNNIKGFSDKTSKKIYEGLELFREFYIEIKKYYKIYEKEEIINKKLKDRVILFTGFRDNILKDKVERMGGRVVSGFSGKVNLLVYKEGDKEEEKSSKYICAEKSGIEIMELEEFLNYVE